VITTKVEAPRFVTIATNLAILLGFVPIRSGTRTRIHNATNVNNKAISHATALRAIVEQGYNVTLFNFIPQPQS